MRLSRFAATPLLVGLLLATAGSNGLAGIGEDAQAPEQAAMGFCDDVTEIPKAECRALVALYDSTDGSNWNNSTGWLQTKTPCGWHGLQCSDGHVTQVSLFANELTGSIPPQLAHLNSLRVLDLSYNYRLGSSIPPELGNLARLQHLDLGNNELAGSIPVELGRLKSLELLNLPRNQLSGSIPGELGELANLRSLNLAWNYLSGSIPPGLGNLTSLRILDLGHIYGLDGSIPAELGQLAKLRQLTLCENRLSGSIPAELGDLVRLRSLDLAWNQLSGSIPPQLGHMAQLRVLRAYHNQLGGSIPAELGDLASLQELDLRENQLTGSIPPALGRLTSIQYLYLSMNQLRGTIPSDLGKLANLLGLDLRSNRLSGRIPPELGNLAKLGWLDLRYNQLGGSIPPELGHLTNVQYLHLSANRLSGSIPPDLGSLVSLLDLRLRANRLEGDIPHELVRLVNLGWLDLGYNMLTASDPSLIAFLNEKDPDWADTQTGPPTDVKATPASSHSAQLSWTTITYGGDGGYYEGRSGTMPGGPYNASVDTTEDKTTSSLLAVGLLPGIPHYFVVRTFTPAHGEQQNDLWSEYSEEAFVTTPPVVAAVTPETGGDLTASMEVTTTLTFPPRAVSEPVTTTLRVTTTLPPPNGNRYLGHPFTVAALALDGSSVTEFLEPYTITVQYNEAHVALLDQPSLGLHEWDEGAEVWQLIGSTLDSETNVLEAVLDHLGTFAALGETQQVFLPLVPLDY